MTIEILDNTLLSSISETDLYFSGSSILGFLDILTLEQFDENPLLVITDLSLTPFAGGVSGVPFESALGDFYDVDENGERIEVFVNFPNNEFIDDGNFVFDIEVVDGDGEVAEIFEYDLEVTSAIPVFGNFEGSGVVDEYSLDENNILSITQAFFDVPSDEFVATLYLYKDGFDGVPEFSAPLSVTSASQINTFDQDGFLETAEFVPGFVNGTFDLSGLVPGSYETRFDIFETGLDGPDIFQDTFIFFDPIVIEQESNPETLTGEFFGAPDVASQVNYELGGPVWLEIFQAFDNTQYEVVIVNGETGNEFVSEEFRTLSDGSIIYRFTMTDEETDFSDNMMQIVRDKATGEVFGTIDISNPELFKRNNEGPIQTNQVDYIVTERDLFDLGFGSITFGGPEFESNTFFDYSGFNLEGIQGGFGGDLSATSFEIGESQRDFGLQLTLDNAIENSQEGYYPFSFVIRDDLGFNVLDSGANDYFSSIEVVNSPGEFTNVDDNPDAITLSNGVINIDLTYNDSPFDSHYGEISILEENPLTGEFFEVTTASFLAGGNILADFGNGREYVEGTLNTGISLRNLGIDDTGEPRRIIGEVRLVDDTAQNRGEVDDTVSFSFRVGDILGVDFQNLNGQINRGGVVGILQGNIPDSRWDRLITTAVIEGSEDLDILGVDSVFISNTPDDLMKAEARRVISGRDYNNDGFDDLRVYLGRSDLADLFADNPTDNLYITGLSGDETVFNIEAINGEDVMFA